MSLFDPYGTVWNELDIYAMPGFECENLMARRRTSARDADGGFAADGFSGDRTIGRPFPRTRSPRSPDPTRLRLSDARRWGSSQPYAKSNAFDPEHRSPDRRSDRGTTKERRVRRSYVRSRFGVPAARGKPHPCYFSREPAIPTIAYRTSANGWMPREPRHTRGHERKRLVPLPPSFSFSFFRSERRKSVVGQRRIRNRTSRTDRESRIRAEASVSLRFRFGFASVPPSTEGSKTGEVVPPEAKVESEKPTTGDRERVDSVSVEIASA